MGKAKYVFRLDDISDDMDFEKFRRLKEILNEFNVKPLLGVIPANKDKKLIEYGNRSRIGKDEFWEMIRNLHIESGWQIALHGYDHEYRSSQAGLLRAHLRSEFAGVDYQVQAEKIRKGKELLEKKGLKISAFMAPCHTFDKTTLKVLEENGIGVVTDGYGVFSYKYLGLTFVPQLFAKPRVMPFGVYTFCFHTNEMTEESFFRVRKFLSLHSGDVISFEDAAKISADNWLKGAVNLFVYWAMYCRATIRLGTAGK